MNQHFNLSRFGRLMRKHTAEHVRGYLMGMAVLAGGMVAVLGGLTYIGERALHPNVQMILFTYGLLAAGAMFTASVFAAMGDQRQAAPALLLPASHLEKYLVVWLYSLAAFLVVYTCVFLLIDALTLQLAPDGPQTPLLDLRQNWDATVQTLLTYAALHAGALWGAIYLRRRHVIKVAFAVFGLVGGLALVNFQVLKRILVPDIRPALPFSDVVLAAGGQLFELALPPEQQPWLILLPLLLAVLLWVGAYARLTEKQL